MMTVAVIPNCGCAPISWGLLTASPSTPTSASPGALKRARPLSSKRSPLRTSPNPRAALFSDSVGVGWYAIDIHGQATDVVYTAPTKPFQIPLGALVSRHLDNLLAACKNIGTTHITNGCYRLHPVEWNIGEAAGALAAFCFGSATDSSGCVQQRRSAPSVPADFVGGWRAAVLV